MPITNEDILSADSPYDLDGDGYLSQEERLAIAPSEFAGKAERDALLYGSEGRKPPEVVEEEMEPVAPHEEMNIGEIFTTVLNESAAGRDPLAALLPQDPATLPARPHEYNAYLEDPHLSAAMNDEEKRLLKKARGFDYDNENIYIGAPTPEGPMGKEEVDNHRREQQLAHTRAKAAIKLLEEEKTRAEEWAAKHPNPSIDRTNPLKTYREVRRAGLETIGMTGHEGEATLPAPIRGMTQGLLVDFPTTVMSIGLKTFSWLDRAMPWLIPGDADRMTRTADELARERRAYDQAQRVLDTTDPMVTSVFPETVFTPAAPGLGEFWTRAVRGGTKSIIENVPLIFTPGTMVAYHAFKGGHDQWVESKDLGRSDWDAGIDATLSGTITGIVTGVFLRVGAPTLERSMLNMGSTLRGATAPALRAASRVPGGAMSRSIARSGVVKSSSDLVRSVALGAGAESLEEATDYTLQAIMQVHRGVDPHALDSEQYWGGLGEVLGAAVVGGGMGGVLDVSGRPMDQDLSEADWEAMLAEAELLGGAELEALRKSVEKLVKDVDSGAKGAATALIEANKHLGIISEKDIRETDGAALEQLLEGIDAKLSSRSPEMRREIAELLLSLPPVPTDRAGFTAATGRKGNQAFREMYADVIEGLRTAVPSMPAEVIGEELGEEAVTPAMESIAEGWRGVLQERMIQAEQGRDLLSQLTKKEMGDPSTISDEKIQQIFERHPELFPEQQMGKAADQALADLGIDPSMGITEARTLIEARIKELTRKKSAKEARKFPRGRALQEQVAKLEAALTALDGKAEEARALIQQAIAEIQSPTQPAQTFREYYDSHPLNPELRAEKAATGPLTDLAQDIPTDKMPELMRQLQSAFPDVVAKLKEKQEKDAAAKQKADEADRKRLQKDLDKLREKEAKGDSETKEEAPFDPKATTFEFEALDSTGTESRGVVEAKTEEEAESLLRGNNLFVTKLTKKPALAEPAETVTEEPTLDDTPDQAAKKVRRITERIDALENGAAPAKEGDHELVVSLIHEALPGVVSVTPSAQGKLLYQVRFKNGVTADLVIGDKVTMAEESVTAALAKYGLKDTPGNREEFAASLRGSFRLHVGDRAIDSAGLIQLRHDLDRDTMTRTLKHEHFHLLEKLGLITPKELAALKETHFDPQNPKSLSEQLASKSELWRPGGTLYYKMKRMIKSLMRMVKGFATISELTGEEVAERIARGEMDTRRNANDAVQALREAGGPTGISDIAVELDERTYANWKQDPSSLPNEVRWSIIDKYQMDGRELTPQEAEIWDSDPVWFSAATEALLSDDVSASAVESTPAFKKWFGRSKVVSSDGSPKVVYHGTAQDVSKFSKGLLKWFSSDPEHASEYAVKKGADVARYADEEQYRLGGNVGSYYLSLENPLNLRNDYAVRTEQEFGEEILADARADGIILEGHTDIVDSMDGQNEAAIYVHWDKSPKVKELLSALGYDGIQINDGGRLNYGVLKPSQIKSATANRGTFDPESDDISYSAGTFKRPKVAKKDRGLSTLWRNTIAAAKEQGIDVDETTKDLMAQQFNFDQTVSSVASEKINRDMAEAAKNNMPEQLKKARLVLDKLDLMPMEERIAELTKNDQGREEFLLLRSVDARLRPLIRQDPEARETVDRIGDTLLHVSRATAITLRSHVANRSARHGPTAMPPMEFNESLIRDVINEIPKDKLDSVLEKLGNQGEGEYGHDLNGTDWVTRMASKTDKRGISEDAVRFVHDAKYLLQDDPATSRALGLLFDTWRSLGLFSGPATQMANIVGYGATALWNQALENPAEAGVAWLMERFIPKRFREGAGWEVDEDGNYGVATIEEIKATFGPAIFDGMKLAYENLKFYMKNEVDRQSLLLQMKDAGDRENIGRTPGLHGPRGSKKYIAGRAYRLGYTGLGSGDTVSRSFWGTLLAAGYAVRIATAKHDNHADRQEAAAKLYEDMGSPAWHRADQEAREAGAQNKKNLGWITQTMKPLGDLISKHSRYGPGYIVPVIETPLRLADQALLRTPVLGLAQTYYMDTKNKNLTPAQARKHLGHPRTVARQMLGMFGLAIVMGLRQMDDDEKPLLTGAKGGRDRRSKDNLYAVAPPMSFRFPGSDTYFSYARIDPFAGVLATLVDTADNIANVTPGEAIRDSMNQISERTYMKSLVDFVTMIEDVQTGGDRKALERWGINFAQSWVPNIIRQPLKALSPDLPERKLWGRGDEARNRMFKRLAQGTEMVPGWDIPRYDRWGRPIKRSDPPGPALTDIMWRTIMPFRVTNTSKSLQFDLAIYRWNVEHPEDEYFLMTPQKYFKHEGEQYYLSDEQWANYMKYSGRLARLAVQGLKIDPGDPSAEDIERGLDAYKKAVASVRELLKPYWLRGEAGRIDSLDSIRD